MKRRGELIAVKNLFAIYQNKLQPPQETVIVVMCEVLNEVLGVTLKKESLKYNVATKTLTVNVPSILKQEIRKQNDKILTKAKNKLGSKTPTTLL
jgi:hypothetical protein